VVIGGSAVWYIMAERLNTTVCTFDPASPKITAFEIHEWIHNTLRIPEQNVTMIQVDGIRRQVFIRLVNNDCVQTLLRDTSGEAKYKHHSGEVSTVGIAVAGLGMKQLRVANLPSEVSDTAFMTSLAPFGKVLTIQQEMWTKMYRCPVANGICQVTIMLTKHIPSHLTVAKKGSYYLMTASRPLAMFMGRPATSSRHAPKGSTRE
jgi:hypothetical protein